MARVRHIDLERYDLIAVAPVDLGSRWISAGEQIPESVLDGNSAVRLLRYGKAALSPKKAADAMAVVKLEDALKLAAEKIEDLLRENESLKNLCHGTTEENEKLRQAMSELIEHQAAKAEASKPKTKAAPKGKPKPKTEA